MSEVKVAVYFTVKEGGVRLFLSGMQLDMNDNEDGVFIGYEVLPLVDDYSMGPEAEARLKSERIGKLNVELQGEQQKRAFYAERYTRMKRALRILLDAVEEDDPNVGRVFN